MTIPALPDLPVELWTQIAFLAFDEDAESALHLVETCKAFHTSATGKAIRYLNLLDKHGFPRPPWSSANAVSTRDDLNDELRRLAQSRWPGRLPWADAGQSREMRHHARVVDPYATPAMDETAASSSSSSSGLQTPASAFWPRLCDGGRHVAWLDETAREIQVWSFEDFHTDSSKGAPQAVLRCEQDVAAWDIDIDAGLVVVVHAVRIEDDDEDDTDSDGFDDGPQRNLEAPRGQKLTLRVYDATTGQRLSSPHQAYLDCDPHLNGSLRVEVLGRHVLLQTAGYVQVLRWLRLSEEEGRERPPQNFWPFAWVRPTSGAMDDPLLSAHLLGCDVVAVLSRPANSSHGRDWGSTIELYKLPWEGQEMDFHAQGIVATIQLPIRARPAPKEVSWIRTGLGKRWMDKKQDAAVAVCVEGFVWMADLKSFADILFPSSALAVFGSRHLTLDTHWVRAHMHRCSLSSPQTYPLSLSLSGWRVAAIWARPRSNASATAVATTTTHGQSVATSGGTPPPTPPQQREGQRNGASARRDVAEPTVYLRALDANPARTDAQKVTSRDQRPDLPEDEPTIFTVFTGDRFSAYCDHDLSKQLQDLGGLPIHVQIDGPRMMLSGTRASKLLVT